MPLVKRALRYLELRQILKRHPEHSRLVRITEGK